LLSELEKGRKWQKNIQVNGSHLLHPAAMTMLHPQRRRSQNTIGLTLHIHKEYASLLYG
jgi:hypothetical protein